MEIQWPFVVKTQKEAASRRPRAQICSRVGAPAAVSFSTPQLLVGAAPPAPPLGKTDVASSLLTREPPTRVNPPAPGQLLTSALSGDQTRVSGKMSSNISLVTYPTRKVSQQRGDRGAPKAGTQRQVCGRPPGRGGPGRPGVPALRTPSSQPWAHSPGPRGWRDGAILIQS